MSEDRRGERRAARAPGSAGRQGSEAHSVSRCVLRRRVRRRRGVRGAPDGPVLVHGNQQVPSGGLTTPRGAFTLSDSRESRPDVTLAPPSPFAAGREPMSRAGRRSAGTSVARFFVFRHPHPRAGTVRRTGRPLSMTRLQLAIYPTPAQPWSIALGLCAHRAGGELRPSASMNGKVRLNRAHEGTKRSDRFGMDRTYSSAGGPGGGATGV